MRSANYVEETTTSIAGTSGDGAITLTAITNTPRFSTVFGTQATTIRYVIEDTVNKKFETGVGSVASNVLTRTRPQVTWDGTTYDDSTPAALQFGSSPASGNVKIRMGATAESQGPTIAGTNNSIGAPAGYEYSGDLITNNNGASHTINTNREVYVPYLLPMSGLLTGFEFIVATAQAATNCKTALYSCGSGGLPSVKIVDFNVISLATTGSKTDTTTGTWSTGAPVFLTAGWYFVGFISDASTAQITGFGTNQRVQRNPLGRSDGYGYGASVWAAGSYATGLPTTPTPTNLNGAASSQGYIPRLRVIA